MMSADSRDVVSTKKERPRPSPKAGRNAQDNVPKGQTDPATFPVAAGYLTSIIPLETWSSQRRHGRAAGVTIRLGFLRTRVLILELQRKLDSLVSFPKTLGNKEGYHHAEEEDTDDVFHWLLPF